VRGDGTPPDGALSQETTSARAPRRRARPRAAPPPPEADTSARSAPSDTRGHRTLLGLHRAERALRVAPDYRDDPWDQQAPRRGERDEDEFGPAWDDADAAADWDAWEGLPALPPPDARMRSDPRLLDSSGRLRGTSAARPLPAVSRHDRTVVAHAMRREATAKGTAARLRARGDMSGERPASALALSTASVPDLVAYRPAAARRRVDTRAIIETARRPWSLTRIALALLAAILAILTTHAAAGESPQPLMFSQAAAGAGSAADAPWPVNAVTARVQPETQLLRADQYDSVDQMNLWGPADCSAAVLSEVLTAYGVPGATIGHMVNELGADISPHGGLLDYEGFNKIAQLHGYRADIYMDKPLTYPQMQYLTNTLGVPVIVNVHISYGYYRFFAGGHFLVMTYGDDQGLRLVDSSEYYVKYLPMDVFKSMFTQRTVVIVPKDFQYTLPT
jgi:hypothetical protein